MCLLLFDQFTLSPNIDAAIRPSYLKRLKEQKRNARAIEKRDARKARREAKSIPLNGHGTIQAEDLLRIRIELEQEPSF